MGAVAQSEPMAAGGVVAFIFCTPVAFISDLWQLRKTICNRPAPYRLLLLPPPTS